MDKTDDKKSYGCKDCIDHRYDRLCLENETKSISHFFCHDRPFIVEKSKVSIFYLAEKSFYRFPIDDKKIGKYKGNKKLRKYNSCIGDI